MSPHAEEQIVAGLKEALAGRTANADRIWQAEIAASGPEAAGRIASVAAEIGLLDEALRYERLYATSAPADRAAMEPLLECSVAHSIGAALLKAQRPAEAEPFYRRAVEASRTRADDAAIALHTGNLAVLLLNAGKAQESIPFFRTAIDGYEKCGDRDNQAWMLTSLGNAQDDTGEPAGALASYEAAAQLANDSRDYRLHGAVLNNLGAAKGSAGETELAVTLHEQALAFAWLAEAADLQEQCERNLWQDLLRTFPKEDVPAWFEISRGRICLQIEDHEAAERSFQRAVESAEKSGSPVTRAVAWRWLAGELMRNGKLENAEDALWNQVEAASAGGETGIVIHGYGEIARLLMRRGEYALALRCRRLQDVQSQGAIPVDGAMVRIEAFLELGNWRAARSLLRAAREEIAISTDSLLHARAERAWGEVALLRGSLEEANNHLISALAQAVVNNDTSAVMDVALSMGRLFFRQGQFDSARGHFREAVDWAVRSGDKTREIAARCRLASALMADGDFDGTLSEFTAAGGAAQELGHKPYLGMCLAGGAEAHMWRGDFAEAHHLLEAAIRVEHRMALGLDDDNSVALLRQQQRTYELFQACLLREGRTDEALLAGERLKAKALGYLLEQRYGPGARARRMKATLQQAALRVQAEIDVGRGSKEPGLRFDRGRSLRILGMDALSSVEPEELTIADIQAVCRESGMTIISYSWLPAGDLYAWVISESAVDFRPLLAAEDTALEELTARFQSTLQAQCRGSFEAPVPHAEDVKAVSQLCREAYAILIAPLAGLLPDHEEAVLGIVPSGTLFRIPFPALLADSGPALVDRFALIAAPSIRFFRQTQYLGGAGSRALVIGNPSMPDVRGWREEEQKPLPQLPESEAEASQVAGILKAKGYDALELLGKDAGKQVLLDALKGVSVAHIATHSLLDEDDPHRSAIALSPAGDDTGFLTAAEIARLDTHLDLVVLSACRTGAGEITGDGVAGLARSWHAAGARSVVFSLWSVDDHATSLFMEAFYRAAVDTGNLAGALSAASRETRKQFPNPLDWAAFALSGQALLGRKN